jgi:hypothetical protein
MIINVAGIHVPAWPEPSWSQVCGSLVSVISAERQWVYKGVVHGIMIQLASCNLQADIPSFRTC